MPSLYIIRYTVSLSRFSWVQTWGVNKLSTLMNRFLHGAPYQPFTETVFGRRELCVCCGHDEWAVEEVYRQSRPAAWPVPRAIRHCVWPRWKPAYWRQQSQSHTGKWEHVTSFPGTVCPSLIIRLQVFDEGGNYRSVLECEADMVRPSGIHLSADDTLYVVNYLAHKVLVYKLSH